MAESLEELVREYGNKKLALDTAKQDVDLLNKRIKRELSVQGIDEYEGEDYTVSISTINSDKMDEDKLIELLKTYPEEVYSKIIFKKEFVDLDSLEDAVYNRVVDATEVDSCINKRPPTVRLNLKRVKKGEDNE